MNTPMAGRHGILLVIVFALAGCAGTGAVPSLPSPCLDCEDALRVHGACETCGRMWVAGLEIPSERLHEALDAHGHEVDAATLLCLECVEMIETDGFCRRCRHGYLDGQLYFSELSWAIHHGVVRLPAELECNDCRALWRDVGVCTACGSGWVGAVRFTDLDRFSIAAREYARLVIAVERSSRCDLCGAAGFFGLSCPTCGTPPIPEDPRPPSAHGDRGNRTGPDDSP